MNETSTVSQVETEKSARHWQSQAGPLQTKKAMRAIQCIVQEGQTYTETWGVLGVKEESMSFYSPFGGCRQDAKEALQKLAERFDYTITRENFEEVIVAAYETVAVLKNDRPVAKDTRKTPDQAAEQDRQIAKNEAARERARIVAEMPTLELGEAWVNCVPEFRGEIKALASTAAKSVGEVFAMWLKYSEACRSSDQSAVMPEFLQIHKAELAAPVFVKVRHRGHLRELIEAGQVEATDSYHFDDSMGTSRGLDKPMPVAIKPDDWKDRKEGIFYVCPSDFDSNCGRMTQGKTGIVTLYVHSNCNYTFRIKPAKNGSNGENTPSGLPQDASEATSAGGVVVRRNLEHNGVEIAFPDKPYGGTISRLKAAGFRWSPRSKVWYRKFGAYAWAQAHTIAGLPLVPSGAVSAQSAEELADGQTDDMETEAKAYNDQLEAAKKLFPEEAKALG